MVDTGVLAWFSVTIFVCFTTTQANTLARGWGDNLDWQTLEDGLKKAKEENKPLMVVIHKTWCGACRALKPLFAETKEIGEIGSNFIMVNLEIQQEKLEKNFTMKKEIRVINIITHKQMTF
ncbi:thioredoxin domain-containing protein 12-like isoform X2 [Gigantopelta aegis]|uniref:thioredoxin domain-containing protein 12-like isoform X2 n=1 Tax=Gigantopelta aegis TaxID=1735272 RepID=UPI001B88A937|nr:thioredoxin domain-containing protein 12-like isoform X2 [Gigantopelta aegis]